MIQKGEGLQAVSLLVFIPNLDSPIHLCRMKEAQKLQTNTEIVEEQKRRILEKEDEAK